MALNVYGGLPGPPAGITQLHEVTGAPHSLADVQVCGLPGRLFAINPECDQRGKSGKEGNSEWEGLRIPAVITSPGMLLVFVFSALEHR